MEPNIEEKGITKSEMTTFMTDFMTALMAEQFDMIFRLVDDTKAELKAEIKADIRDLRNEMNERFSAADKTFRITRKRIDMLEENTVQKHEFRGLTKRVEKLETSVA